MKRKYSMILSLVCLILSSVILFSSCSTKINATELSKGSNGISARDIYEKVTEDPSGAAKDVNGISFELFSKLLTAEGVRDEDSDTDNTLFSPLSALLCFALIANGTDGDTRTQIESSLGISVEKLSGELAYFSSLLNGRGNDSNSKAKIANSLWIKDDGHFHIEEEYLRLNADYFNSQIYSSPFDNSTADDINRWVSHYTDGMIKKIIDGSIPTDAIMYLINALCFDAKWETEYEKSQIHDGKFSNIDGNQSNVKMLHSSEHKYLENDDFKGVVKNYQGGYSFVGLLPKDENADIYEYAHKLDGKTWSSLYENVSYRTVHTRIPEFKYDLHTHLKPVFESIGIDEIFNQSADFSKLGYYDNADIFISLIDQKVHIELDRNGTKAAAITWGEMKATAAAPEDFIPEVYLDRPFIYMIIDQTSGIPLFIGIVENL